MTEAPTEEIAPLPPTATTSRPSSQQSAGNRLSARPSQRRADSAQRPAAPPPHDLPLIPIDDDGWPTFDEPPAIRPRVIEEARRSSLFANLDAVDDAKARAEAAELPLVEPFADPLADPVDVPFAIPSNEPRDRPIRGEDVRPEDEPPTEEFPALDAGAIAAGASASGGSRGAAPSTPSGRGRRGGARREGPIATPPADPYGSPSGSTASGSTAPVRTVAAPIGFDDEAGDHDAGPVSGGHPDDGHHDGPTSDRDLARGAAPRGPVSGTGTAMQRSADRAALHFFHPERLEACQHAIKYHFRDITLLENALTHSSIKSDDRPSYERLEFLGDSVVGLIIAEHLYDLLPDCDEGEMTRLKSAVVSTDGLANAALEIGLEQYLAVGRGLMRKNEIPRSLIADVFEGVTGAVYLDRGYETAKLYVLDHLGPFVHRALSDHTAQNFKSVLQQVAQRDLGETPQYDAVREWGPEHTRQYEVVAVVGRRRFPAAHAPTKREAEQAAAKLALQVIMVERGAGNISAKRRHDRGPDSGAGRGPGRGPSRGAGRGPSRGSRGGPRGGGRGGPRGGARGGPR